MFDINALNTRTILEEYSGPMYESTIETGDVSIENALMERLDGALDLLMQHGDRMIDLGNKAIIAGDRMLEMQQKAHRWQDYARELERRSGLTYDQIQSLRAENEVK